MRSFIILLLIKSRENAAAVILDSINETEIFFTKKTFCAKFQPLLAETLSHFLGYSLSPRKHDFFRRGLARRGIVMRSGRLFGRRYRTRGLHMWMLPRPFPAKSLFSRLDLGLPPLPFLTALFNETNNTHAHNELSSSEVFTIKLTQIAHNNN